MKYIISFLCFSFASMAQDQFTQQFEQPNLQQECKKLPPKLKARIYEERDLGGNDYVKTEYQKRVTITEVRSKIATTNEQYDHGTFEKKEVPLKKIKACESQDYNWQVVKSDSGCEQQDDAIWEKWNMATDRREYTDDLGNSLRVIFNHIDDTKVEITEIRRRETYETWEEYNEMQVSGKGLISTCSNAQSSCDQTASQCDTNSSQVNHEQGQSQGHVVSVGVQDQISGGQSQVQEKVRKAPRITKKG